MMLRRFTLALSTCALAACGDIPILPQWDADWYVPLPSQNISLRPASGLPVLNGTTYPISFNVTQPVDDAMGQILSQELGAASLIVSLRKTINLYTNDTLIIANSAAGLTTANDSAIVMTVGLATADTLSVDTIVVGPKPLRMLRNLGTDGGTLHIKLSGIAGNNSGSSITVAPTDLLGARIAVVVRIPVSR